MPMTTATSNGPKAYPQAPRLTTRMLVIVPSAMPVTISPTAPPKIMPSPSHIRGSAGLGGVFRNSIQKRSINEATTEMAMLSQSVWTKGLGSPTYRWGLNNQMARLPERSRCAVISSAMPIRAVLTAAMGTRRETALTFFAE